MKRILFSISLLFACAAIHAQLPNAISDADKVYGLSSIREEVNQSFVYLPEVDRTEWNNLYKRMITDVQKTENDYEYYRLLQKFCAFLKDGHTDVYFPHSIRSKLIGGRFEDCCMFLANVDGKAIISHISVNKKDELPIGTEIIAINGITTQDHINQYVNPYICTSTEQDRMRRAISWHLLQHFAGTVYDLECLLPNGQKKTVQVKLADREDPEMYPKVEKQGLVDFKWLENNIAYVSINTFADSKVVDEFKKYLPELGKAKKLIIDLRKNGGGNSGNAFPIIAHLTNDSALYTSGMITREYNAAYKSWSPNTKSLGIENNERAKKIYLMGQGTAYYDMTPEFNLNPSWRTPAGTKRVVIPTAVLIGNGTFSSAEDFLLYSDHLDHFVKIGDLTGGSSGNPIMINLPGGGGARVCSLKDTYLDGRTFVGTGILPDILVKYTVRDYAENNDPVLNEALKYLNSVNSIADVAKFPRASRLDGVVKVPVYWAGASSFQDYEGIEKSYDSSPKTFYHSAWDNKADDYFPIKLDYSFQNQEKIDYIVYHPRQDGINNGYFKEVEIWVATESNPEFVKWMDFDFKGVSTSTKVDFEKSVIKPKTIRFIVKSGAGFGQGFASCSEMVFFRYK